MKNRKTPFGYKVDKGKIVLCKEEAELVTEIFRRYNSGEGYQTLVSDLREHAIPYCAARPWNKNIIARIISDSRYTGESGYTQIISKEVYDRACEKRLCNTARSRLSDTQKILQRLSDRKLSACEEKSILILIKGLINRPEILHPIEHSLNLMKINELKKKLEQILLVQPIPVDEARALAFQIASSQYELINDSKYETEHMRVLLHQSSPEDADNAELLKSLIKGIRIDKKGTVFIELKNHQIISSESGGSD